MANPDATPVERQRRRRHHRRDALPSERPGRSDCNIESPREPDVQEIRRAREDFYTQKERRGKNEEPEMPLPANDSKLEVDRRETRSRHKHRRVHKHSSRAELRPRTRRKHSSRDEASAGTYVYKTSTSRPKDSGISITEVRRRGSRLEDSETSEAESDERELAPIRENDDRDRDVKYKKTTYVVKEEERPSKHSSRRRVREEKEEIAPDAKVSDRHRSRTHRSSRPVEPVTEIPKRSSSTRHHRKDDEAPSIRRSHTTRPRSTKPSSAASTTTLMTGNKRSSLFGGLFTPNIATIPEQPRLVECLTCSDEVPQSRSALLKCGHRMCNSCLRRIFRLSVKDPAHMPPKCCTSDFIPLKHVEKLFETPFKRKWNMKYQEYTTKDRMYCPARSCGEWIKPTNIHIENGTKYAKCSSCKMKVCCLCNGKWHRSRECPKDEETTRLLEEAKKAGWQRCFNCRTMVELKEGCNHMTCRCTAEFCMICGLKWKTCNCPWFNFETVEADRLNHMRVPDRVPDRYRTYDEEISDRRRQEQRDERLARRLQRLHIQDPEDFDTDYQGGIGDILGIGHAPDHFMNQDYVRTTHNIIGGNMGHADLAADYIFSRENAPVPGPPGPRIIRTTERYPTILPWSPEMRARRSIAEVPPPVPMPAIRRQSVRPPEWERGGERGVRSSITMPLPDPEERMGLRRSRTDYAVQAARHAPQILERGSRDTPSTRARDREREYHSASATTSLSSLAGLDGGKGCGRVDAWRAHVGVGVVPDEGVITMVPSELR